MAITGKINEPVTLTSTNAGNWVQLSGPTVILRIGLDQKTCSFTPSVNGNYEIAHNNEIFVVTVGGGTAPTPGANNPPVVTVTSPISGEVNKTVNIQATVTDSDGQITNIIWNQESGPQVNLIKDGAKLSFVPTVGGTYVFSIEAQDDDGAATLKSVTVNVPVVGPTPTPTGLLWGSNENGKWNDGVKRTITVKEGTQKPNDKSIFVAASGDPKLVIDGDGIAHLVSGSGGVSTMSIRLRSRHQGECNNVKLEPAKRFGGHGWSIDKNGSVEFKTEQYHNEHSGEKSFNGIGTSVGADWHHWKQSLKGNQTSLEIDGKAIGSTSCTNHGDDSLLSKNSYIWLRLNNSDHGRIYIMAINIDSQLDFDFKFEASNNSIAFRNVRLVSI